MADTEVHTLSRAALLEHNKQQYVRPGGGGDGGRERLAIPDRLHHADRHAGRKAMFTHSKMSGSDRDEASRSSQNGSLLGAQLSHRAYRVTQRLSRSLYMTAVLHNQKEVETRTLQNDKSVEISYQNSYKLPDQEHCYFRSGEVQRVAEVTLQNFLLNKTYDPKESARLSCQLSTLLKSKMKELHMPRYKLVCQVILGQKFGQSCEMASKCLWDVSKDNYACASYENQSLYAVALIHGVYFE